MTEHQTLVGLLGEWVTVRNPDLPISWYGRLVGLHEDPGVLLAIPGRGSTCLPQRFTVTRAEAPAAVPAAKALPDGALDSATAGGDMLDAWAQTPAGRNLLAHALTQLARDGWLRREPADPWEPVPDATPAEPESAPAADCGPACSEQHTYGPDDCAQAPADRTEHRTGGMTDPVRTRPDSGVRIEYRARVPRRQAHLAIAEAFGIIARETGLNDDETSR